jgi:outer membrane receptor for ferrienterochelin and colicins
MQVDLAAVDQHQHGVINIITYHPIYDSVNAVSVTGGTQSLTQGSLAANLKAGANAGARVLAGGCSDRDFSTPQAPQDLGSRGDNMRAAVNLRAAFAMNDKTQVELEATDSRVREPDYVLTGVTVDENIHTNLLEAVVTTDSAYGLTEARLYRNGTDIVPAAARLLLDLNDTTLVAQLQQLFKVGTTNTFRLAAEYQHDRIDVTPVGGAELSSDVLGASAMWEWKLRPAVTLTNALRVDRIDYGRNGYIPPTIGLSNAAWDRALAEFSFNSGLVWTLTPADQMRFTVARGVQMPSLAAIGAVLQLLPVPGLYVGGDPFLEPTINLHYEVGWNRRLPWLGSQLGLSAYYDSVHDVMAQFGRQVPVSPGLLGGPANIGDSRSYGLELLLKGHAVTGGAGGWATARRGSATASPAIRSRLRWSTSRTPPPGTRRMRSWAGRPATASSIAFCNINPAPTACAASVMPTRARPLYVSLATCPRMPARPTG